MAIGAALLPKVASAATAPTLNQATIVEYLKTWYANELERLGAKMKPLFESGEVHGFRKDPDLDEDGATGKLERACAEHFNLSEETPLIDICTILAASPSAEPVGCDWTHPCHHAAVAVCWDLIVMARERGWYTPPLGEEPTPNNLLGML
jgi:hypothetical protein